jgi:hypothetical protein
VGDLACTSKEVRTGILTNSRGSYYRNDISEDASLKIIKIFERGSYEN